jgi:excisionase family DNA binding protein
MPNESTPPRSANKPIAVNKREAAQLLGVSLRTIDRLIAIKELQVRRLGRRVLIPRSALESFLRRDHPTQEIENVAVRL